MHADFRILVCTLLALLKAISSVQAFYIPGEIHQGATSRLHQTLTTTHCRLVN